MNKKGQSSMEYLLVVVFSLLMIIPATILFMNYTNDTKASVIQSQVFKVGNELITDSEQMFSVGKNSWQTINIQIPETVTSMKVYNGTMSELVLTIGSSPGSDVVLFTKIPLFNSSSTDCSLGCSIDVHQGMNAIRIKSTTLSSGMGIVRLEVIS